MGCTRVSGPSITTNSPPRRPKLPDVMLRKQSKNYGGGINNVAGGEDDYGSGKSVKGGSHKNLGQSPAMLSVVASPPTPESPTTDSPQPATTSSIPVAVATPITTSVLPSNPINALARNSTTSMPTLRNGSSHPLRNSPCVSSSQTVQRELHQLRIVLGSVAVALSLMAICSAGWFVYARHRLQTKKRKAPSWQIAHGTPPIKFADPEVQEYLPNRFPHHLSVVRSKPKEHRVVWMDEFAHSISTSNTTIVVAMPPAPLPVHRSAGSLSNPSAHELSSLQYYCPPISPLSTLDTDDILRPSDAYDEQPRSSGSP